MNKGVQSLEGIDLQKALDQFTVAVTRKPPHVSPHPIEFETRFILKTAQLLNPIKPKPRKKRKRKRR